MDNLNCLKNRKTSFCVLLYMSVVIDSNREMTEPTEIRFLRSGGAAFLRSNQDEGSRKQLKVDFQNTEINGMKTILEKKVRRCIGKSSELRSARKKEDLQKGGLIIGDFNGEQKDIVVNP